MEDQTPFRILVIDDDSDTQANLRDILGLDGYDFTMVGTAAEALDQDDWSSFGALIVDWTLPDGTAETLLPHLRERAPEAALLVITGTVGLSGALTAIRHTVVDYILKPIDPDGLRASLARVAEHQRLLRDREQSQAAFRTLVETAPCVILILRPDRSIVYFSPFAARFTGYAAEDVLGKDYASVLVRDDTVHRTIDAEMDKVFAGGRPESFESPLWCKDGSQRRVVWTPERLDHFKGGPALLALGQDVTERQRAAEHSMQEERLAAVGQAMTGLIHEGRNALQRCQASVELLVMEVEDRPEALDLVAQLQKAQDHLHRLYEEVREYAEPLSLQRERHHLGEVIEEAWDNLQAAQPGRQAQLRQEAGTLSLLAVVDRLSLNRAFRAILDNALAASADPVAVEAIWSDVRLDSRPALRVGIRDNGPGLTAAVRSRIFDPFFTTKTHGTGLGMALAKRIVDAHGGRIGVGDDHGSGAEIVVTLPRGNV